MTQGEYHELVDFLAVKFEAIDRRFTAHETRLTAVEDRLTRVEVLQERQGDDVKALAEGLGTLRAEVALGFGEVTKQFGDLRHLIEVSFRAQQAAFGALAQRVDLLEKRR